ncbi:hypothetical protein [Peptoniphilus ovalis]|nr:hypothetical protein [Peptoniphilus ovalis]
MRRVTITLDFEEVVSDEELEEVISQIRQAMYDYGDVNVIDEEEI